MRETDELQPDNDHVLPGAAWRQTMSWRSDLPNDDERAHKPAAWTLPHSHLISSALEWLGRSVDGARRYVNQTILTDSGDRSLTFKESSRETAQPAPIKVSAADVKCRMDCGERFAFVDARTIDEWIECPGRIEHAVRMSVSEVAERLGALPRDRMVITYSMFPDDEASSLVASELARLGVANVHPMIGGLQAWRAVGGPIERV
jgi:rhodanese-related sulfurtransferase